MSGGGGSVSVTGHGNHGVTKSELGGTAFNTFVGVFHPTLDGVVCARHTMAKRLLGRAQPATHADPEHEDGGPCPYCLQESPHPDHEYVIQKSDKRPGLFDVLDMDNDRVEFQHQSYEICQDWIDHSGPWLEAKYKWYLDPDALPKFKRDRQKRWSQLDKTKA